MHFHLDSAIISTSRRMKCDWIKMHFPFFFLFFHLFFEISVYIVISKLTDSKAKNKGTVLSSFCFVLFSCRITSDLNIDTFYINLYLEAINKEYSLNMSPNIKVKKKRILISKLWRIWRQRMKVLSFFFCSITPNLKYWHALNKLVFESNK